MPATANPETNTSKTRPCVNIWFAEAKANSVGIPTTTVAPKVSLPSADHLLDGLNSFLTALMWPETQQRIQALLRRGLQQDSDFEKRWPDVLGSLLERAERTKG